MKPDRDIVRCDRGAAAVEFAIVSLILIALCLGIIDFGRGLYLRNNLAFAADLGARRILVNPAIADSAVHDAVREGFQGAADLLQVESGRETISGIAFRTIVVSFPLALNVPGLTDSGMTLRVARRVPAT
jgi:Flp pilus assembly protein TadG